MDIVKLCELFEKEVLKQFGFLIEKYSFSEPSVENCGSSVWITYISSKVYLKLVYGGIGRDITMTFGRIGIDNQSEKMDFYHEDIRQSAPTEREKFDFMAFNEKSVILCV